MNTMIRKLDERDHARWKELFDGYTRFYEREPEEPITQHTWSRILDPASPIHGVAAEVDGSVAGIAHYILHESTGSFTPVCYLQDLYVDPSQRASGIGRSLIDWLLAEAKAQGWSRVYWNTRENNYRARGLYDKYTPHSGFLRYVVKIDR
jgi:GNAT superfamily N-acetyltransferase